MTGGQQKARYDHQVLQSKLALIVATGILRKLNLPR